MKSSLTFPAGRHAAGFTLIELMITLAIVAILVALAYPSYNNYIMKSHRADAKTALLDLASRQERYFALQNNYASTPSALGYAGTAFPLALQTNGQTYYQLSVQVTGSPGTSTLPGFSASAVPASPGPQQSDACGTYTINQLGVQGNSGNTTSQCW
ncbi:type IV pilin protein [Ralstonia solanacearum]|uniref:type IV pilin protein n=1 Tax=Ralstonia solanacearum TaxID=305 RepID=UPI000E6605A6|nr:type IV pilin protein [Ralstonia solanacearum]MBT1540114.1 type IV pilin protein [Ralstonia solanacearum]RIJ84044.1 pilus assembly protein [Ralstonia solanacearum]